MKSEDLLSAIGEIDDKYIEEADIQPKDNLKLLKKRRRIRTVTVAAACLCIAAVGTAIALNTFGNEDVPEKIIKQTNQSSSVNTEASAEVSASKETAKPTQASTSVPENTEATSETSEKENPSKNEQQTSGESSNEIAYIPRWDKWETVSEQYTYLEFNGEYYGTKTTVSQENLGEKLGTGNLSGYDVYEEKNYYISGCVYAIKSIASKCAVAVNIDGSDKYYIYRYEYYYPETLGDLIRDLSLKENMSFGTVYGSYRKEDGSCSEMAYEGLSDSVVWEMLLSDESVKNAGDYMQYNQELMSISVNIPIIGDENISMWVTDTGYLCTNIMDYGKSFYIGTDKVREFVDYVKKNCNSYDYFESLGNGVAVAE